MINNTLHFTRSCFLDQVTIHPSLLHGHVRLPISKSLAHRVILAKALASITSQNAVTIDVNLDNLADDVLRTLNGAAALMTGFYDQKTNIENDLMSQNSNGECNIYCKDSGTTLRMIMPIACTLYDSVSITVTNQLAQRPMDPLIEVLKSGKCEIHITDNKSIIDNQYIHKDQASTFTYHSHGKFQGGLCQIAGNISSQYISGLLYALPLTENGGEIRLTTPLASKPYLDMTLAVLKNFGIQIKTKTENDLLVFQVAGKQQFKDTYVNIDQGDWSAAAFFAVANSLGSQVEMDNLNFDSLQGDKIVYSLINKIKNDTAPVIDLEDYPDLFPVLVIFASFQKKTTQFIGLSRLKIKESDRIISTTAMLRALHCRFQIYGDNSVWIYGTGRLTGGTVDSYNDHRIAMAAAIGATRADGPVTILGSSCCDKSYPDFFKDYVNLGGKID